MFDSRYNPLAKHVGINTPIVEDRPCAKCSYNVRGLKIGDRCPECGTPIRGVALAGRSETMTDAPLRFLRQQAWGARAMLACGLVGVASGVVATAFWYSPSAAMLAAMIGAAAACGWAWAVWRLTRPRQSRRPRASDAAQEWKVLRALTRWSQVLWGVGAIHVLMASTMAWGAAGLGAPPGSGVTVFLVLGGVFFVGGIAGIVPLAIYLSLLADWAQDTSLASRLRLLPFALVLAFPLAYLTAVLAIRFYLARAAVLTFSAMGVVAGVFLLVLGFLIVPFFQFASVCAWAVRNCDAEMDRDRRLTAKIVERIEGGRAKAD